MARHFSVSSPYAFSFFSIWLSAAASCLIITTFSTPAVGYQGMSPSYTISRYRSPRILRLSFPPLSVWAGADGFHFSTFFEVDLPARCCFVESIFWLCVERCCLSFVDHEAALLSFSDASLDSQKWKPGYKKSCFGLAAWGFCICGCGVHRVGIGVGVGG